MWAPFPFDTITSDRRADIDGPPFLDAIEHLCVIAVALAISAGIATIAFAVAIAFALGLDLFLQSFDVCHECHDRRILRINLVPFILRH